jgi:ankyrin repeat protein
MDVNTRDKNGNTALVVVIEKNDVNKVQVLLDRGANPNSMNVE